MKKLFKDLLNCLVVDIRKYYFKYRKSDLKEGDLVKLFPCSYTEYYYTERYHNSVLVVLRVDVDNFYKVGVLENNYGYRYDYDFACRKYLVPIKLKSDLKRLEHNLIFKKGEKFEYHD